jgi:hypothetical protein
MLPFSNCLFWLAASRPSCLISPDLKAARLGGLFSTRSIAAWLTLAYTENLPEIASQKPA